MREPLKQELNRSPAREWAEQEPGTGGEDGDNLQTEARRRAERGLLANGGKLGLLGSNEAYQQVWARDSMVCGLGLLLCGDAGQEIHRRSLETLRAFQTSLGKIPHNVGLPNVPDPALIATGGQLEAVDGGMSELRGVEDTIHAGCVDGNLWYIIGHYCQAQASEDISFLREAWPSLEKALLWLRYQDSNECGLLEVHEAMDWADLFANRYNVLFDNVLYYAAWRCMGHMARLLGEPHSWYLEQAADVRRKINTLLWIGPEAPKDYDWIASVRKEWLYPIRRVETELVERPFYLPYMAFRDYADRFDTLANLLAILFGVADEAQANKILDYIHGCGLNEPYPVQALYPVIHPGEADWREYYRVRNLNQPHHYHNGGAWPFIGGFYVVALVRAGRHGEAEQQLHKLTLMNREGRRRALGDAHAWEFNEWFHGQSGRPMGYGAQSWSMALYIYAHEAVTNARNSGGVPFLNF
jgi:glycogen debranching enzyme